MADETATSALPATDAPAPSGTALHAAAEKPAAATESLLRSKPAAEPAKDAAPPAENPAEGKAAEAEGVKPDAEGEPVKPGAPEKYDLKLPDGVTLDPALVAAGEAFFRGRNFDNETAQAITDWQVALAKQSEQQLVDYIKHQREEHAREARNDPEFGGKDFTRNVAAAQAAVDLVHGDELVQLLTSVGLENHPAALRVFWHVSQLSKEARVHGITDGGKPAEKSVSQADSLYRSNGAAAPA